MRRLRVVSAGFVDVNFYFEPFDVEGYHFTSVHPKPAGWPENSRRPGQYRFDTRSVHHTGFVEFSGRQEDSILFKGGAIGTARSTRKRKLIDYVLLLACLLTGKNWSLYSRRIYPDFPVINANHLECLAPGNGGPEAGVMIEEALQCVRSEPWQTQFEGGFHLRMLRNHANILTTEARFLSLVVIWEWLFAHLRNPSGAPVSDERKNLKEIFTAVLEKYWPGKVNRSQLLSECIFHRLRNQLAHCGRLPVDRRGAPDWMKKLHCDFHYFSGKGVGVIDYIRFFRHLTQVVVLKTLGVDAEDRLAAWSFRENLASFLDSGKIAHRC